MGVDSILQVLWDNIVYVGWCYIISGSRSRKTVQRESVVHVLPAWLYRWRQSRISLVNSLRSCSSAWSFERLSSESRRELRSIVTSSLSPATDVCKRVHSSLRVRELNRVLKREAGGGGKGMWERKGREGEEGKRQEKDNSKYNNWLFETVIHTVSQSFWFFFIVVSCDDCTSNFWLAADNSLFSTSLVISSL